MSKQQVIQQIQQQTRGIPAGFLETFDEATLGRYLARLADVKGRRGPVSGWVPEDASPTVVGAAEA